MNFDLQHWSDIGVALGLRAVGALLIWIVGRWLIGLAVRLLASALNGRRFDPTLARYLDSVVGIALNVILIVAILGHFGVETTSFAALVAGVGIAVGAAWGGLLRPYCNTAHCWQVYFDMNRVIRETFSAAGYPVPEAHQVMRTAIDKPMVRAA